MWGDLVEAVVGLLAEVWPREENRRMRALIIAAWVLLAIVAIGVTGYLLS